MKTGVAFGSTAKAKEFSRAMYAKEMPARARNRSRLPSKKESHAMGKAATSCARFTSSSSAGSDWSGSSTP
jgi:hypothetical protein